MAKGQSVLVTGGAGFIGSHTVDLLVEKGYEVNILDNLEPQVHQGKKPDYLNEKTKFIRGDIRDRELLKQLIKDVHGIIHLASAVGVGQSMYQIEKYVEYNTKGTATLLDVLVNEENGVEKFVVASSMSIYGEGKYYCEKCGENRFPESRSEEQLKSEVWDPLCSECQMPLKSVPTDEDKPLMPTSIYAMSKRHQEEMCLLIGKTYGIPTVALRYFNVFGTRQALSNPYTGCIAIFSSRILNGRAPYIFEDGNQLRDFVHVRDIARANVLALEKSSADYQALNIGTGGAASIRRISDLLVEVYGAELEPFVSQEYRKGDVRHCYADITKARRVLGYKPSVSLEDGLREVAEWARAHEWGATDLFEKALSELKQRQLIS